MNRTVVYLFLSLYLIFSIQAAHGQELQRLEPNKLIEREIAGGETQTYRINVAAGQLLHIAVEQKEIDVTLILVAPDGRQLAEMNLTGVGGLESLSAAAAADGNYQLSIKANGAIQMRGAYQVRLETQITATPESNRRIVVERLMIEAGDILRQPNGKTAEPAIKKLESAIPVWSELNDKYWLTWSLSKMGVLYFYLNHSEKAIEYSEEALKLARENRNRSEEGNICINLGSVYYNLGRYEKAIEYREQALTVFRDIKDRAGEARALNTLGSTYSSLSRYEKAIEYYEQSLVISREIKFRTNEGNVLYNLGRTYNSLSREEKAIEYLDRALTIYRETGQRANEGLALNVLGNSYLNISSFEKAIEYYEQSLAISREVKNRFGEASSLSNLGIACAGLKNNERAIGYYEQALAINREIKNRAGEAAALNSLGEVYFNLNDYQKAVGHLEQALAINREVGNKDRQALMLYNLARTNLAQGNIAQAQSDIEESLKVAESIRSDISSSESRTSLLARAQDYYRLYIELLMRQNQSALTKGFDVLAVETSERQRARSLLYLLTESKIDLRQGVDSALIERERTVAKQLEDKAQALIKADKPEQTAALKLEISRIENDLERAQTDIRKASPRYAALTQPKTLNLKEIQFQLDDDTVLLEYSLGKECSYLWAITKDSLTSYELPKESEIKENALQVYNLLTARNTRIKGETFLQRKERISSAEAKLPASAKLLSDMILKPAAAQMGNKRLVIVADGALQYIPFAMLPEPMNNKNQTSINNLQPLVINHEIVSLPSASALAIQRNELINHHPASKTLAVIADPVFDKTDERFKTVASTKNDETQSNASDEKRGLEYIADANANGKLVIRRLPFTEREASGLLALVPKSSSFEATGFQANRETVMSGELAKYRYVHFATHGLLDAEHPGLSALVLSMVDAQGKAENGFLRANDIYNMKLPAELVVLSACQTGLGKEVKGEGLVGLTRGFMYAGARRVAVSLWNVNDKATADLMERFYRGMLKQNERPAAALRAAQIEMWKQKAWQSPYFWSAFIIQGDWR